MNKLADNPEIITLASELGLDYQENADKGIIKFCLEKINTWVKEHGPVKTMSELENIVCSNLGLVFEEIKDDNDLKAIIDKYVALKEYAFKGHLNDFDEHTFAAVLRRRHATKHSPDRFVAVIDCRGIKAARKFFSKWHEIAHLLSSPHQYQFIFHRTSTVRSPTERLMDEIAGVIGFYDPILRPMLTREINNNGTLTFEIVDRIRKELFPEASFQATLIACVKRASIPVIYVEAKSNYKKKELAQLQSNQLDLFPNDPPKPELRAYMVFPNDEARKIGLRIDPNMKVPERSIISSAFNTTDGIDSTFDTSGVESLRDWKHSNGVPVGESNVRIEARRVPGKVIAIVTIA